MIRILFRRGPFLWVVGMAVMIVCFFSLVAPSGSAYGQNKGVAQPGSELIELFARVSSSVGALYTQSADGDLKFTCTVTVVEHIEGRTALLTAGHCVDRDVSYMVTLDGKRFYAAKVWKLPPELIDPQKHKRSYGEPAVDMALFITDEPLPAKAIRMGMTLEAVPGLGVVTVGYPLGVTKIRYNGIVAGAFERPGADLDGYIMLQIFGAPGSSGSAVIEQNTGSILAVLVQGKQGHAGLPVIFATPIRYQQYLTPVGEK